MHIYVHTCIRMWLYRYWQSIHILDTDSDIGTQCSNKTWRGEKCMPSWVRFLFVCDHTSIYIYSMHVYVHCVCCVQKEEKCVPS